MDYVYKAIDKQGRRISGQLAAHDLNDLEHRLHDQNLDLIAGQPVGTRRTRRDKRLPRRELINFCFHLDQMLSAGVPMLDALNDLRDATEHPRWPKLIAAIVDSIEGGSSLSQALGNQGRAFGPVFVSLVRAGENSGRLPEILSSLSAALKWEDELAARTHRLLIYPAIVAGVVLMTTAFLMIHLVPQLQNFVLNMGQQLPWHSRMLFLLSGLLIDYWPQLLTICVLIALTAGTIWHGSSWARLHTDRCKLRLPVIGPLLKKLILSRFAEHIALLYAAGIPLLEALRMTRSIAGNRWFSLTLQGVEQSITDGRNLTVAFQESTLFPPLVIRMLRIGENTGALDQALRNVGYFYSRDVRESAEKAQALIEPGLTLFTGLLLGWVMLSVLGPIYDVISRIRP